jgi:predicted metalloprotease with PDZ domain
MKQVFIGMSLAVMVVSIVLAQPKKRTAVPSASDTLGDVRLAIDKGVFAGIVPSCFPAASNGQISETSAPTLYYRIMPIRTTDRTDLDISVRMKAVTRDSMVVKLPTDYYGTQDLYRYVTSFEGESGTTVKPGKDERERVVQAGPDSEIHLRYLLSFDPKVLDGVSFGPNVGPTHFHTAGCQWLLQIGNLSQKRRYEVEIIDPPIGWHFYSSIGPYPLKFETEASYNDLIATAIGGGAGAYDRFMVRGRPVSIFVQGVFDIPSSDIFKSVRRIVTLERDWFQDYDQPFYHVTILPRGGIIAGTANDNFFVCFAKHDISREELYVLLAHEMFHTWLPNKLSIELSKGESELRYEWFYEGFTDYFARRLLAEAGLLSQERFAYLINRDIINIADNPNRNANYADLVAASTGGKYGTTYKKLSYYRGALIALNWEAKLGRSGKRFGLGNLIRDLYGLASRTNHRVTAQQFFELAARYGLDAKGDLDRYILRGESIVPLPDALGPSYVLSPSTVPSFDPGFSLEQTFRNRKVTGVVENGVAYLAGLREGMELVRVQNSNRFGNGWYPDRPLLVVTKVAGQEHQFEFFPRGEPLTVMLFQKRRTAKT